MSLTRRHFVWGGAAGAAGAVMFGSSSCSSDAEPAFTSGSVTVTGSEAPPVRSGDPSAPYHPNGGATFVFNSAGKQSANRFNVWADLMEIVGSVDGPKIIQFEQSETFTTSGMPPGGWNLNGSRFFGGGVMYNGDGGIILTVEDRCKFVNPNVEWLNNGLVLYSVSTESVVDIPTMPFNVYFTNDVQVCAKKAPIFKITAPDNGAWVLMSLRNGGHIRRPSELGFKGGDAPVIDMSSTGSLLIVYTVGTGHVSNDTISGSVGTVVRIVQSMAAKPADGAIQSHYTGTYFLANEIEPTAFAMTGVGRTYLTDALLRDQLDQVDAKLVDLQAQIDAL